MNESLYFPFSIPIDTHLGIILFLQCICKEIDVYVSKIMEFVLFF